jgi:Leucine-rich repeat (LRR) protein
MTDSSIDDDLDAQIQRELDALSDVGDDSVSEIDINDEFESAMRSVHTTGRRSDDETSKSYLSTLRKFEELLADRHEASKKVVLQLVDSEEVFSTPRELNDSESKEAATDELDSLSAPGLHSNTYVSPCVEKDNRNEAVCPSSVDSPSAIEDSFLEELRIQEDKKRLELEELRNAAEARRVREAEEAERARRERDARLAEMEQRRLLREEEMAKASLRRIEVLRVAQERAAMQAEDERASRTRMCERLEAARVAFERKQFSREDDFAQKLRAIVAEKARREEEQRRERLRKEDEERRARQKRDEEERLARKKIEEAIRMKEEEARRQAEETRRREEEAAREKYRSQIALWSRSDVPRRLLDFQFILESVEAVSNVSATKRKHSPAMTLWNCLSANPNTMLSTMFRSWIGDKDNVDAYKVLMPDVRADAATEAANTITPPNVVAAGAEDQNQQDRQHFTDPESSSVEVEGHRNLEKQDQVLNDELFFMHCSDESKLLSLDFSCEEIATVNVTPRLQVALKSQSIKSLSLNVNRLKSLPSELTACLRLLIELRLRDNYFADLPSSIFSGLQALRSLELSMNQLSHLDFTKQIPGLQLLEAHNNRLKQIDGLAACKDLIHLSLYRNQLTASKMLSIGRLSKLVHLDLGRNQLDILNWNAFSGLQCLETFICYSNVISTTNVVGFSNFVLGKVYVNGNRIQQFSQLPLAPLLEELDLKDNQIQCFSRGLSFSRKADSHVFPVYPCIRRLDISFNRLSCIKDLCWGLLPFRHSLRKLDLHDNPVSSHPLCRAALTLLLPQLIEFDDKQVSLSEKALSMRRYVAHARSPSYIHEVLQVSKRTNQRIVNSNVAAACQRFDVERHDRFARASIEMSRRHVAERQAVLSRHRRERFEKTSSKFARDQMSGSVEQQQRMVLDRLKCKLAHAGEFRDLCSRQVEDQMQWLKQPTMSAQRFSNVFVPSDVYLRMKEADLRKQSISKIQRAVRLYLDRKRGAVEKSVNAAAILIQKVYRGFAVRHRSHAFVSEALHRLHARRSQFALLIQKVFRGYRVRQILRRARFVDDDDFDYEEVDLDAFLPKDNVLALMDSAGNIGPETLSFNFSQAISHAPALSNGVASTREPDVAGRLPFLTLQISTESSSMSQVARSGQAWSTGPPPPREPPLSEVIDEVMSPAELQDDAHVSASPMSSSDKMSPVHRREQRAHKLAEEWGFQDPSVAEHMLQRYQKYHRMVRSKERREELRDPTKRLELFKKRVAHGLGSSSGSDGRSSQDRDEFHAGRDRRTSEDDDDVLELRSVSSSSSSNRENHFVSGPPNPSLARSGQRAVVPVRTVLGPDLRAGQQNTQAPLLTVAPTMSTKSEADMKRQRRGVGAGRWK